MRRTLAPIATLMLISFFFQCSTPSASGTKTNWFMSCDTNADCDEEVSCSCGLCTLPCESDAECEEGECSDELQLAAQCAPEAAESICLPSSDECFELAVESDPDLGTAIAPACSVDGALICEGFDQPFPLEYSTFFEDEMSTFVQDCEVYQGAGALHYQSEAPGQSQTRMRLPTPVATGPLHARFFVKLSQQMVLPAQLQLLEFWEQEDLLVPERASLYVSADGNPRIFIGSSNTTVEPTVPSSLPRDTWVCLELILDLQDQEGGARLLVDGVEVISGSGFDSQPTDPVVVVVVEGQPSTDTEGVDFYVDELVVATGPIGCQ